MEYTKVSFNISPNSETAQEILMAELAELPFDSFEETETGLNAYIPTSEFSEAEVRNLQLLNNDAFTITFTSENIPDQNWNETWKSIFLIRSLSMTDAL